MIPTSKGIFVSGALLFVSSLVSNATMAAEEVRTDYQNAYQYVIQQRWPEAREYLQRFVQRWPDSDLADDASYWRCYAGEQEQGPEEEQFVCYGNFLQRWNNSEWRDEVRDRLVVMSDQYRGNFDAIDLDSLLESVDEDWDFDFDFDFDFDGDSIEFLDADERMRIQEKVVRAQQEAVRAQQMAVRRLEEQLQRTFENGERREDLERMQRSVEAARRSLGNVQLRLRTDRRLDSELLAVLTALRDDPGAMQLLTERLRNSDNPEVQARLVLMLEEFDSPEVTELLLELARNSTAPSVRRNAIAVLQDREDNDGEIHALLRDVVVDDAYPVDIRMSVVSSLDDWEESEALELLDGVMAPETDSDLIEAAAASLMRINSEQSRARLLAGYQRLTDDSQRYRVLERINIRRAPELMSFLRDAAVTNAGSRTGEIAVARIGAGGDAMALAVLSEIYGATDSTELQLSVINSLGSIRLPETVEFLRQVWSNNDGNDQQARATVRALDQLVMPESIPVLVMIYDDTSDSGIRTLALQAIRRFDDYDPQTRDFLLRVLQEQLDAVENPPL